MKHIVLALVLLFPAIACAETVSSENFILRDANGNMTAQLTTSGEGTPAFFMYDTAGVVRVSIGLYGDGAPGVVLNDNKGLAGAILRLVDSGGDPVLVLKENGEDKKIIDVRGRVSEPASNPVSGNVAYTFFVGILGGFVGTTLALKARKNPATNGANLVS